MKPEPSPPVQSLTSVTKADYASAIANSETSGEESPTFDPSQEVPVEGIRLRPAARNQAFILANRYLTMIVIQGRLLAAQNGMDEVHRVHIEKAADLVAWTPKKGRRTDVFIAVCSIAFSLSAKAGIDSAAQGHFWRTMIYFGITFISLASFMVGVFVKR